MRLLTYFKFEILLWLYKRLRTSALKSQGMALPKDTFKGTTTAAMQSPDLLFEKQSIKFSIDTKIQPFKIITRL